MISQFQMNMVKQTSTHNALKETIDFFRAFIEIEKRYRKKEITLTEKIKLIQEDRIHRSIHLPIITGLLVMISLATFNIHFIAISASIYLAGVLYTWVKDDLLKFSPKTSDASLAWETLKIFIRRNKSTRVEVKESIENDQILSPKFVKDGTILATCKEMASVADLVLKEIDTLYGKIIPSVLRKAINIAKTSRNLKSFDNLSNALCDNIKKLFDNSNKIIAKKLSLVSRIRYNDSEFSHRTFKKFYNEFFGEMKMRSVKGLVEKVARFDTLYINNPLQHPFERIEKFLDKRLQKFTKLEILLTRKFENELVKNTNIPTPDKNLNVIKMAELLKDYKTSELKSIEFFNMCVRQIANMLTRVMVKVTPKAFGMREKNMNHDRIGIKYTLKKQPTPPPPSEEDLNDQLSSLQ